MEIEKLDTKYIGKNVKYFKKIESTHKYAKQNIDTIETETVIITETQTEGIGTRGKKWYTGTECNIAMTIVLRPNIKVVELNNITIKIAEAIQNAIIKLYKIELEIKVPNDLFLNGKKVCGILTEISSIGEKINYLLISIGINVNEKEFPENLKNIATSLKQEYKDKSFDVEKIIIEIIREIERIM